jgi:hypothetical protein
MTAIIERVEGHYEVHKTSYGEAYVWCQGCVVVGCDCGRRPVLNAADAVCGCGTDHAALVREVLASHRTSHPWDDGYDEWRKKQDEYIISEETYQLELSSLG